MQPAKSRWISPAVLIQTESGQAIHLTTVPNRIGPQLIDQLGLNCLMPSPLPSYGASGI